MTDRKKQPELKKIETLEIPDPEKALLDNGIPVYLFNFGDIGITKIDFVFNAGSFHQFYPLTAMYTNKMLTEGTLSYSSFEIAEKLDCYGAWVNKSVTKDSAMVSLSVLNKHLKHVLPLLSEIINHPLFPENELKIHSQKDKQDFINDCHKLNDVAVLNFNHQLFGNNHPYGTLVKADDFDHQNTKYLLAFHRDHYTADKCKIIVSGKLSKTIFSQLNDFFGTIKAVKKNEDKKNKPRIISGPGKQFIEMPCAVQSAIRVGNITINKTHKDYHKLFILNTVLGGYFGSRLMKNIREDKGYTYGIYSTLLSFRQSGAFIIASEIGAGVCSKAINEIYNELKVLNKEPISRQELNLVRRYLTGTLLRNFDGPFQVAERFRSLLEYELDYKNYYLEFLKTINSVTPEELLHLSLKYLAADNMLELIVGEKLK